MERGIIKKLEPHDEGSELLYRHSVSSVRTGFILVGNEDFCINDSFEKYMDAIRDFQVRDSDVFVASYPKTGTTWMSEMVWMISHNLDAVAGQVDIYRRVPFFEVCGIINHDALYKELGITPPPDEDHLHDTIEFLNSQSSNRVIKTHLQFSLLPAQIQDQSKKPKIIYTIREPKDTCISYYYHCKLLQCYDGTFEDFCTMFLTGRVAYGPFWKHVLGYWKMRKWPNILIVTFEEMKRDLRGTIQKVSKFLDKSLSDEQLPILEHHLSFQSMQNNKYLNGEWIIAKRANKFAPGDNKRFIRCGEEEQYRKQMSTEMIQRFKIWYKEHFSGIDFDLYK